MPIIGATELQPANILGSYMSGLEMGRANRLAQQQQMEAAEAARVQREMRNALAGGLDVTTPEGQARLMQFGAPGLAAAEQGAKISAERARRAEAETGREKTLLDIDTARRTEARTKLDEALKLVTAASRQTYPQIYRQAVELYGQEEIDKLGLSPEYDENLLGSLGKSMISAKDRIDQQLRAREARAAEGRLYVDQTRAQLEQRRVDLEEQRLELEQRKASPEYQEIKLDAKTRANREAAFPKASAAYRTAVNDIDGLIRDLEALQAMPGLEDITGGVEGRLPSFFADATAAQARLDKILAKGQFRSLQALRDASPTGGAVGNVSDAEGKALRDSFAALSQTQDDADFREQLGAAIADLQFAKRNLSTAFDDEYAYRTKGKPSGAPQGGNDVRSEADKILGL